MFYLIARDEAGNVIASRASQSRPYAFATVNGTFHSRRDLVPAGVAAYAVEEITAAEFRALSKAKTDAPNRLRNIVANRVRALASWRTALDRAERIAAVDVSTLPSRVYTSTAYTPARSWNEIEFDGAWIGEWNFEPARAEAEVARCARMVSDAEKRLRNAETRLRRATK